MKTILPFFVAAMFVLFSYRVSAQYQDLSELQKGFIFTQNGSKLTAQSPSGHSVTVDLSKPSFNGKAVAFTYSAKTRTIYKPGKSTNSATIFPNPASESVNLSLKGEWIFPVQAQLFNQNGNVIQLSILETAETSLDISKLGSGVYILDLRAKNAHSVRKLLVR